MYRLMHGYRGISIAESRSIAVNLYFRVNILMVSAVSHELETNTIVQPSFAVC